MQNNKIQYNTIQCKTIQYNTIQYNTIQIKIKIKHMIHISEVRRMRENAGYKDAPVLQQYNNTIQYNTNQN